MKPIKKLPIAITMITGLSLAGYSLALDIKSSTELELNADVNTTTEVNSEATAEAKRKAEAREKAYQAWRSRKSEEAEVLFNGNASSSFESDTEIEVSEEAE